MRSFRTLPSMAAVVAVALLPLMLAACRSPSVPPVAAQAGAEAADPPLTSPVPPPPDSSATTSSTVAAPTTTEATRFARPDWLGTRPLPLRPDGFGEVLPTPPELEDRRLATLDLLPPPQGDQFEWTISPVPAEVVARSTWSQDCPVTLEELRYLTLSFYGFDGRNHTGEMIVNARAAEAIVEVFGRLHAVGFPIEEMRVIRAEELDLHPTGDGNTTTGFVCRPAVGSRSWSQHAYGLAVDVNPFHNPYRRGDLVLPELASAYTDREWVRPGMILPGDVVTEAFAGIGWGWGGNWATMDDWMHFSASGR